MNLYEYYEILVKYYIREIADMDIFFSKTIGHDF